MKKKRFPFGLIGLTLLAYPVIVGAQNSTVLWSAFNMGSGISAAENTYVVSATGEVLTGPSEGENIRTESGFLVVLERLQSTVAVDEVDGLPVAYALYQNFPNPFNPNTTLRFDLPEATEFRIVVYDLLGREVVRLVDQRLEAGYHQLVWNGRDRRGREVPTGMYIARLVTPEYSKAIKMVLLK